MNIQEVYSWKLHPFFFLQDFLEKKKRKKKFQPDVLLTAKIFWGNAWHILFQMKYHDL